MYFISPPLFTRIIFRKIHFNLPSQGKVIYLTFDDGPEKEITPLVLDILDSYNVKATFFCVGNNVQKNKYIYDRIISSGHSIGNHTFNHINGWKTKSKDYIEDVDKCSHIVNSNLFRPPYGRISCKQYKELSKTYKIIMWDVLSYDFEKNISKEKCFDNIIKHSKNGSIIVFHDSIKARQNMLYALPKTLDYFFNKGYTFKQIK